MSLSIRFSSINLRRARAGPAHNLGGGICGECKVSVGCPPTVRTTPDANDFSRPGTTHHIELINKKPASVPWIIRQDSIWPRVSNTPPLWKPSQGWGGPVPLGWGRSCVYGSRNSPRHLVGGLMSLHWLTTNNVHQTSKQANNQQTTNKQTNKVHATTRPLLWASAQWPLRGNKRTHATPASDRQTYTFLLVAAFQSRGFDRGRGAPRLPKHNVKQSGSPWKRAEIQKTQRCANDMPAKAPPTRRLHFNTCLSLALSRARAELRLAAGNASEALAASNALTVAMPFGSASPARWGNPPCISGSVGC